MSGYAVDVGHHDHGEEGLIRPATGLENGGREALPARSYRKRKTFGLWLLADRCRPLGWSGCDTYNIYSGDIQLNELLRAVARQPTDQFTSSATSVYSGKSKSEAMRLGHGSSSRLHIRTRGTD